MRVAAMALGLALVALAVTPAVADAKTVRGKASFMPPVFGPDYLALPEHRWGKPGLKVKICNASGSRCVTRTSTDAGPDKAMQRAGRVADLNYYDFKKICGCDPYVVGLVRVTVRYLGTGGANGTSNVGPKPTLPATDTGGTSGSDHTHWPPSPNAYFGYSIGRDGGSLGLPAVHNR